MHNPHLYAIIIGSEILNGRRVDKHVEFIKSVLSQRGYVPYCIEIITDDKALITSSFKRVLDDPDGMLFCFGGIGSTPDDLTRAIAANVFTGKDVTRHKTFERDIIERFGDSAFPNRIEMSDLPEGSRLLKNPVNNMSGFYLEDRYFFTPGFPEMAHPMINEAIERFLPQNAKQYRKSFLARCSEERFIELMKRAPQDVECSSLPVFVNEKANVEISIASYSAQSVKEYLALYIAFLESASIDYEVTI